MAGSKIGDQAEEFERLLILAEEDKAQTPKAKEALRDWRTKYDSYGAAMFFSPKQWDWLKSLAGEEDSKPATPPKSASRKRREELDDDIPY